MDSGEGTLLESESSVRSRSRREVVNRGLRVGANKYSGVLNVEQEGSTK